MMKKNHVMSNVLLPASERFVDFSIACYGEEYERRHASGPLNLHPDDKKNSSPLSPTSPPAGVRAP
jgi:hypothetical protein